MTGKTSTVSVVLCTCNGARYLPIQLASIAAQIRVPDELVIRDDASTDSTVTLLEDFAAKTTIPVRLTRNPTRLGVNGNFGAAIADASCDYLALCDQDDVWDPNKLEVLAGVLDAEDEIAGVVSNALCIDKDGRDLPGGTVWERNRFNIAEQRLMDRSREIAPLLRGNVVPGACLMFRESFRDVVLPISYASHYDWWIALLLQSVGGLAYIDAPLQRYRLHSHNSVGMPAGLAGVRLVRMKNGKSGKAEAHQFTEDVIARLIRRGGYLDARSKSSLREWNCHTRFRANLPRRLSDRASLVVDAALKGNYRRYTRNANRVYSGGTVSWLYDLAFG
jgi:glycosyltransferase involved in cell wall biosynthesis